jgi:hypothetical protein
MRNLQALSLAIIFSILAFPLLAQTLHRSCATHEAHEEHIKFYPEILDHIEAIERHTQKYISTPQLSVRNEVITIPVVVHVVYRTANPTENISDAQILSQIEALNNDYRRLNNDAVNTPSVFQPLAADCGIEFKLAKRTPDGKETTGIVRYASPRKTPWGKSDEVKMPSVGGIAPWDASKYLNLYVCAIGGGILGYSSMPGGLAIYDGVVIDYRFFGTKENVIAPFHLGRTTTHEVGHWLNLRHTWGDSDCGDDLIYDTPKQREPNYGCSTFPHISCSNDSHGDMFMNFMDYSDDACMNMFSKGQKARIQALFTFGGARASLLTSNALIPPSISCKMPTNLNTLNIAAKSVEVSWKSETDLKDYTIEYKTKTATSWLSMSAKNLDKITLSNLVPNTEFEWRIKTNCTEIPTFSNAITFKTTTLNEDCKDIYESNNTFSTAKEIPLNTTISALIDNAKDNDYFVFKVNGKQKHIQIVMTDLPFDYDVRIYNSRQQLVGTSNRKDKSDEKIILNNAPMDNYYVRVYSALGSSNVQCYNLTANVAENIFTREDNSENFEAQKPTEKLQVFPNPASETINIELEVTVENTAQLFLMDLTGKIVYQKQMEVSPTNNIFKLDITQLNDGFYLLNVRIGSENHSKKVMIVK